LSHVTYISSKDVIRSRRSVLAALLLLLVFVGACGPTQKVTGVSQSSQQATTPYTVPAHREHATVMYCPDITGSYPRDYFRAANHYVADSLDAAVQVNQDGVQVFVTYIDSEPYSFASTPLVFSIPSIGNPGNPPSVFPAPTTGDPYKDPDIQSTANAQMTQTASAWNNSVSTIEAQVAQVHDATKKKTNTLRQLNPKIDSASTSVLGCLALATSRFAANPGDDKWLVIASDMDNNSNIDLSKVQLDHVHVRIIWFACKNAGSCQSTMKTWQAYFAQTGVLPDDLKFYDKGLSEALQPLLSGQV
jgi:hypothetical protein